jgi:hypothetical protein
MVWNKLKTFLFPSRHGLLIASRASGLSSDGRSLSTFTRQADFWKKMRARRSP